MNLMADKNNLKDYADLLTGYLASQTKMVIFILDNTGRVVWVNDAFREMISSQVAIEGRNIRELLAPESRELLAGQEARITDNMHLLVSNGNHSSHMLTCRVFDRDGHTLVLSEQIMATETAVMQHMTVLNNELSNLSRELHRKNVILEQAMAEIKVLKGLLPICMHCKKIRDEEGYWSQIETYIMQHSNTEFSHGICDDCQNTLYPEQAKQMRKDRTEKG
jgi:hypothetical protein